MEQRIKLFENDILLAEQPISDFFVHKVSTEIHILMTCLHITLCHILDYLIVF